MIKVAFDQAPLATGHAIRGIGNYTRQLLAALKHKSEIELLDMEHSREADVIHLPYFDLFQATLPLKKVKPTVVTIHDTIPLLFPKFYPVGFRGNLALTRQKLALKNVAAVITESEACRVDIQKYLGVPQDKIHVIFLAGNPELEHQLEASIKKVKNKYKLPNQYILYVGDINYNKNVPQLIKALKYLPDDLHLVCVGSHFYPHPIPEWQAIETQLALSDVTDRVQFVTEIKAEKTQELAACYSGAIAYVQPSLAEGFGLPVLEAMQCQTPVVAAHNSSLIEIGGDVVVPVQTDGESIAQGVKEVLSWSASLRADKIQEAFQWSHKFSWAKTAAETVAVYQAVSKSAP